MKTSNKYSWQTSLQLIFHFLGAGSLRNIYRCFLISFLASNVATAQQFIADNQWVAPHGSATIIGTAGQDYSQFVAVAALIPEWEFNAQLIHYYDNPKTNSDSYTSSTFFAKRRLIQNEAETAGYAIAAGVGLFPQHLDQGEVLSNFQSYFANAIATYAFANNNVLLDIVPGATVNFDHKQSNSTAWGFTYSSRLAAYKIIPQSAIVAEVFGTAGEARSPISYRAGVRWESPKLIVSGTYSSAFRSSFGVGFEIGIVLFTKPFFGIGH